MAHHALLSALTPLLRSFFGQRLRGMPEDVEDLVQETLIAVHVKRSTYDTARPFTAWTYSIARYKLVDHFRSRRSDLPLEGLEDILVAEGFEGAASARMDMGRLLARLPAKQADAIRGTKLRGLSVSEAAEAGGLSETDVKVSVHRGLKRLAALVRGK